MSRGTLASLRVDLTKLVDQNAVDELKHVAGQAAKKAALDVAARDLGSDRAFSGFKRKNARLDAGYDLEPGSSLILNLRSKGLWTLANTGRRAKPGVIAPRKGGNALNTPWGPRANVKQSAWGGFGALKDAEIAIERDTFRAVDAAVAKRIQGF